MRGRRVIPLLLSVSLCLAGCQPKAKQRAQSSAPNAITSSGVFDRMVEVPAEETKHVVIYYKDKAGEQYRSMGTLFEKLKAQGKTPKALINGGMVSLYADPVGLLIVDGKLYHKLNLHNGKANFSMGQHGVFGITKTGKAVVFNPQDKRYPTNLRTLKYATQSGPLLVSHGKIVAGKDWRMLNSRSAVGVKKTGELVFVQCNSISLRAMAEECLKYGMRDVLFLDGGGYGCIARTPSEANLVQRYAGIIAVE